MRILGVERFDEEEVGTVRPRVEKTICINSRGKMEKAELLKGMVTETRVYLRCEKNTMAMPA